MARVEIEAVSLAERAYRAVRDMIVSLELRPGAVINERELMERFAIGRTPMREGLHRLAQEKFVAVYPRRGMFVTTVEIRDLAALCEVRLPLEGQAARLAAARATEEDKDELDELIQQLRKPKRAPHELMALDERIHRTIYRIARNEFLEATAEQYYVHALRIWYLALDRATELGDAVQEHYALLQAITAGDARQAEKLVRAHVQNFEDAMSRVLLPL
ncbi:MAG TPA: GntR family transcriptional regulator [Gaiellaceae bacterium]|jgi:DNA-binding GntR family transcriptional regulator